MYGKSFGSLTLTATIAFTNNGGYCICSIKTVAVFFWQEFGSLCMFSAELGLAVDSYLGFRVLFLRWAWTCIL